jgi:hypothetical protein
MGGLFVMISPNLREQIGKAIGVLTQSMNDFSPVSYILAAIGIFAVLTMSIHKAGSGLHS